MKTELYNFLTLINYFMKTIKILGISFILFALIGNIHWSLNDYGSLSISATPKALAETGTGTDAGWWDDLVNWLFGNKTKKKIYGDQCRLVSETEIITGTISGGIGGSAGGVAGGASYTSVRTFSYWEYWMICVDGDQLSSCSDSWEKNK
jgi:hypothetical protein